MEALLRTFMSLVSAAGRRFDATAGSAAGRRFDAIVPERLVVEVAASLAAHSPAFARVISSRMPSSTRYMLAIANRQSLQAVKAISIPWTCPVAPVGYVALPSSSYISLPGAGRKFWSACAAYQISQSLPTCVQIAPPSIHSVVSWRGTSFASAAGFCSGPASVLAQSCQGTPMSQVKRRLGSSSSLLIIRCYANNTNGRTNLPGGSNVDTMNSVGAVGRFFQLPIVLEAKVKYYNSMTAVGKLGIIALSVSLGTVVYVGYCMYHFSGFLTDLAKHVEDVVSSAKVDLARSVNQEIMKSANFRANLAESQLGTSMPHIIFVDSPEFKEFVRKLLLENEELKRLCSQGNPVENTDVPQQGVEGVSARSAGTPPDSKTT